MTGAFVVDMNCPPRGNKDNMEDKMRSIIFFVRAAVAVALCSSGWSLAADVNADEAPSVAPAVTEIPGFGTPLASARLDGYRGGFDVVKNDMQLTGAVTNNSAVDVLSGSNFIADGSFANASGMPMVVQNSGSNVLIQNAMIINVQMQ